MFKFLISFLLFIFLSIKSFADTKIPFTLDWKFEGPSAPFFNAIDKGYFKSSGLDVEISPGKGSLAAIPKVATGAFPFGFADINSLIKFLDQNPGAPVIAIMMIYDKPPFAIIGRKSLGINSPADLIGSVLGAPPPDGAWAQFPSFAKANSLDINKIKIEPVGFPTREPMLAILMADHGLNLYGNAIIVNTDYAKANSDVVKSFLVAIGKGWKDAVANPSSAIESLVKRNPAADSKLEERRFKLALSGNVMTDYVAKNGMGNIDYARFEKAINQLSETYNYKTTPNAKLYFTDAYLPKGGFKLK